MPRRSLGTASSPSIFRLGVPRIGSATDPEVDDLGTVAAVSEPSSWRTGRSVDGGVDRVPVPATSGALWVCGKHHIAPDVEKVMERLSIDTVVCLNQQHELTERYPEYVRWLAQAGETVMWHPVPDLHAPPLDELVHLADEILRRLDLGHGVLVHCGAGIGRAGTVVAAVLMRRGVPLDRAVAAVASARPTAGPEAGAQRDVLEELAVQQSDDPRS